METVRFHIHRKGAFAGCTLTYRLNINGAFVGALKNGGTLDIIAARAKCYYIDKAWSFDERNGYFEDDGSDEDCNYRCFTDRSRNGSGEHVPCRHSVLYSCIVQGVKAF